MGDSVEMLQVSPAGYKEIFERYHSFEKRAYQETTSDGTTFLEERDRELRKEFVEELMKEKDRFKHVYVTENGSVYFDFADGKSTRFLVRKGRFEFEYEVVEHIYFVKPETEKFLSERGFGKDGFGPTNNFRDFLGCEFEVFEPALGLVPFQFGRIRPFPEIFVSESDGRVIIKGDKDGNFTSGKHFGHKIAEVLK